MNLFSYLEGILVVANCALWLGPLIISVRRNSVSLLHPASMFPLFVTLSMLVAMTEHWFGWSGRGFLPGIRVETRTYIDSYFFIEPLVLLLCSSFMYHYGVMHGCGRLIPDNIDRMHLDSAIKTVKKQFTIQLFGISIVATIICIIPFVVFGQGWGFFWTSALIYSFNFIPVMLMRQDFWKGVLFLFFGFLLVGIRGSKGDFIYYILPVLVFYQETFIIKGSKRYRILVYRIFIAAFLTMITVVGTTKLMKKRGVIFLNSGVGTHILIREYGFEVFSILVKERSPMGEVKNGSWIIGELIESLPSALGIKKKIMGHEVARVFLPRDFEKLPDAGFHRFFLFPLYHDFGWLGSILGSFIMGIGWGWLYNRAILKSMKEKALWPMFVYLPLPVYAELVANGAISYVTIHIAIAALVIWFLSRLAMLKVVR